MRAPILHRSIEAYRAGHRDHISVVPTRRACGASRLVHACSPRVRAVLQALLGLAASPTGLGVQDLARTVRAQTGWDDTTYTQRHATYDLKKLRAKALVTRVGRSRRYQVELTRQSTACAWLLLHDQVFLPVLSAVAHADRAAHLPPHPGVDAQYAELRRVLLATMQAVGIAA
jgi:hypothetical protein